MDIGLAVSELHRTLMANQRATGTWGYRGNQDSVEATCLAILALRRHTWHQTCAGDPSAPGSSECRRELASVHR